MAYGRNLTDEMTSSGGFDIPLAQGSHGRYRNPGQVVGFRLLTSSKQPPARSKPRIAGLFFVFLANIRANHTGGFRRNQSAFLPENPRFQAT